MPTLVCGVAPPLTAHIYTGQVACPVFLLAVCIGISALEEATNKTKRCSDLEHSNAAEIDTDGQQSVANGVFKEDTYNPACEAAK